MGLLKDSEGGAIIGVFKGEIDVSDPLMNRSVCVSERLLIRCGASKHLGIRAFCHATISDFDA